MSKWGIEEKETLDAINNIDFSGKILNIAAGDGRFNNRLLEIAQSVTAIDIDDIELKALRKNCPASLINKLYTKTVDITQEFPFHNETFDGVFCTDTLHLFDKETLSKIFQELRRVLKPNGKIIIDFLITISIALFIGLLAPNIFKKANLPIVTIYIITGVIIGPYLTKKALIKSGDITLNKK